MLENSVIFDTKQPQVVYGILGDTYVYANEQEVQVDTYPELEGGETPEIVTPVKVTKYQYDVRYFPVSEKTPAGVLAALKADVINDLLAFDSGEHDKYGDEAVNDFTIGGMHMWLDKDTRVGLRFRFESELAQSGGDGQTTLWYNGISLPLPIEAGIGMLQQLEVYASKCYDQTAKHQAAINALPTIDAVFAYDYKEGYPEHLQFPLQ